MCLSIALKKHTEEYSGNGTEIPLKMEITIWLVLPLLGIYPKDMNGYL